ncbi:MAG: lectin-like protein [Verrucomicrobiota bacterium]
MKLRTLLYFAGASVGLLGPACAQVFTGPYGPGGKWNVYQLVTVPVTWDAADAAAKIKTAASTGLPVLAGNTSTGHLVQISNEDENTFVALLSAQTAVPSLTPASNSNIWIGLTDKNSEQGSNRTGWEWSGTTGGNGTDGAQVLEEGQFSAWFPLEPNNSGTENAGEMRTDGRWNDNKENLAATTRRYVVEWETASNDPVEGALRIPVYYTAPYGAGGKWNLYRVVATATNNFTEASGIATAMTAASTGVAGVTNGALTGHVSSINSAMENDFIFRISVMASNNSVTTWIGATDAPAFGGTEAGSSKTTGWVWAGTTEPFSYQKFRRRYPNNAEEPNNAGTGENFTFIRATDSYWDDVAETAAGTTGGTYRRYVMEWNTEQDAPISGAALAPSVLPGAFPVLNGTDANGTWDIRTIRGVANGGVNMFNALGVAYGYYATGATPSNGTQPVLNCGDRVADTDATGRSTGGLFWPRLPYIGDVAGDDNQFVILAKTKVVIPSDGRYAFNVHSDDGYHFALSGGPANGQQFLQADGLAIADTSAAGGFYYMINNDATGGRGVYQLLAGTYTVEFFGNEGAGGSMFEVSWAPVPAAWTVGSDLGNWGADWKLLGGSQGGTPAVPAALNLPAASGAQWSVGSIPPAAAAYANIRAAATAFQAGSPEAATAPVINFADPNNAGNRGRFGDDKPFPGDNPSADDNFFVTGGRGKLTITEPGVYTMAARVDDFFALHISAPAVIRGRVWGVTAQGHIDSADTQTMYWDVGTSDVRVAVNFPTAGTYDLDMLYSEGSGGSSIELSYAKGAFFADVDTTTWRLIGDVAALSPVLPATLAKGPEFGNRAWGIHTVHNTGTTLETLTDALTALQAAAGDHTSATASLLNFIDPEAPGVGGIFAGDQAVPGDAAELNDEDFALHARGKLQVTTAGIYTFGVKNSDGFALRIKGQSWLTNGTGGASGGIDPADPSTFIMTPGTAALTDRTSRASVNLAAGTYEVDFVTFDRSADFHAEVYVARGQNAGTAEYATLGTAAAVNTTGGGGAAITLTDGWRLVNYTPAGLATLGLNGVADNGAVGWKVEQTAPQAAAPTADKTGGFTWGTSGSALAAADAWFGNATSIVTTQGVDQINFNDPGFGGPGIFPNDQPNPNNLPTTNATNTDDNYFATRMTGLLVVPKAGIYSIGFNSDDGEYFEFSGTGANVPVFTRLVANATGTADAADAAVITASGDGVEGARFKVDGGTGNSRCVAEVQLAAGTYPVKAVWFEGTSSSFNEIFAGPSPAWGRPVSLLIESVLTNGVVTSGAMEQITDIDGLALAPSDVVPPAGPLEITGIVRNPNGSVTITWTSDIGSSYSVEASDNLQLPWETVGAAAVATTTTSSYTSPALSGTRLFWRVRRN